MLRATSGRRLMKPARSRVRIIWWTDGGMAPKCRWMSASAGGRRFKRVGVDEGEILALLGREASRSSSVSVCPKSS
jgi:hypothetical protein